MEKLNEYGGIVPVKDFDDLDKEYQGKGIDLRDILKASGHYAQWKKSKELPQIDADGKDASVSKIYYAMYREAEDGLKACPPNADLWHWLLDTFEKKVSWKETSSERTKIVPIISNAFKKPAEKTEEDIQAYRKKLQESIGQAELDDEAWNFVLREFLQGPVQESHCIDMINRIAEDHGVEMTVNGNVHKVMMIEMKVGR
jgi:hypothetical protein